MHTRIFHRGREQTRKFMWRRSVPQKRVPHHGSRRRLNSDKHVGFDRFFFWLLHYHGGLEMPHLPAHVATVGILERLYHSPQLHKGVVAHGHIAALYRRSSLLS